MTRMQFEMLHRTRREVDEIMDRLAEFNKTHRSWWLFNIGQDTRTYEHDDLINVMFHLGLASGGANRGDKSYICTANDSDMILLRLKIGL